MQVNGYALALAALFAIAVAFSWHHRLLARVVSLGISGVALTLIAAIPAWRDALAGVFAQGPGMVALVALTVFGAGTFALHHIRGGHHAVWTSVAGVIGATCGGMAWAMLPELGRQGAKLAPKTAAAMSQAMAQIRTGQAAHAQTSSERAMVIVIALLAFTALIVVAHRHHRRKPFRAVKPLAALTSGRPAALPPGRPVSAGSGRPSLLGGKKS